MNVQGLRDIAAELQKQLDDARALAAKTPADVAPVLLSDDRVAAMITQLGALAGDLELHQTAFRKIYLFAVRRGLDQLAAVALQFADLATAPPAAPTL